VLARLALSLLSPPGSAARLSVFIFHRVHRQTDPLAPGEPDAAAFEARMCWIRSMCNVLPLDRAVTLLQEGSLPAAAAAITFDDGYADNLHVAVPILTRLGLPATFFIATGFTDGGRMWNDTLIETVRACRAEMLDLSTLGLARYPVSGWAQKRQAIAALIDAIKYRPVTERITLTEAIAAHAGVRLPTNLMMTSDELRAMRAAGMQIGAHTVSHPILATLDDGEATREIAESRHFLEGVLDERIGLFAYPNGKPGVDYRVEQATLVRGLGFDAAVSTEWGAARATTDPFQIPRFTPWDSTRLRFTARVARNLLGS
jgi:peptidoglycan/xylan/chitin deacetylase (PgdA/CDA1 family)